MECVEFIEVLELIIIMWNVSHHKYVAPKYREKWWKKSILFNLKLFLQKNIYRMSVESISKSLVDVLGTHVSASAELAQPGRFPHFRECPCSE